VREIYPLLFQQQSTETRAQICSFGMILLHDETGKFAPFDVFKEWAVSRPAVGWDRIARAAELGDPLATFLSDWCCRLWLRISRRFPAPDRAERLLAHALDAGYGEAASYWRLHTNRLFFAGKDSSKFPHYAAGCVTHDLGRCGTQRDTELP